MTMNLITCFLFFLLIIPYTASLTFNITNFSRNSRQIKLLGAAFISNGEIQVTSESTGLDHLLAGRAAYIKPFLLWNKISGELASFSTSFTFVIDSDNAVRPYGDGLTFFLAQDNSQITGGESLGLPFNVTSNVSTNQFVAVEFDTYCNDWENRSLGAHVGININSLMSVRYRQWFTDIPNGRECRAWIEYDSFMKNLSVSFTQNNTVLRQDGLYYNIDLRDVLPERVIFGFTAATALYFEKHSIKSWMFNSSSLEEGASPSRDYKLGLIISLSILIAFFILGFVLWMRKKKNNRYFLEEELEVAADMNNEIKMGVTGPRKFSYLELSRSTGGFLEKEKLGEGGFGGVYKGFLRDLSMFVAVKRVSKTSKQGIKEYASEVKIISQLRHKNLVQLIGWCHEKRELLLVYEYMENGSLDLHLFKAKSLLSWGIRYKIAHDLASALLYLHEEWKQCVLHRDIKSSNVILDSDFNAKLGDFGLAKLVDHEKGYQTTIVAGTLGYMSPECLVTCKATKESDVFSFGVVALEISCGRKPIEYKANENEIRLIEWVWELYGAGTLLEAVDPRLGLHFEEEEIKRLMIVGLWCVHPNPQLRPSMRQVLLVLNSEAFPPTLPSRMPVASYLEFPTSLSLRVSNEDMSREKASCSLVSSSYLCGR